MTLITTIVSAYPGWSLFLGFWLAAGTIQMIGNLILAYINRNETEE